MSNATSKKSYKAALRAIAEPGCVNDGIGDNGERAHGLVRDCYTEGRAYRPGHRSHWNACPACVARAALDGHPIGEEHG